jgi:putative ABC transport system ATP-binding protein
MGPSGSGKSTLLNLVAGIDKPSSGTILVAGVDIAKLSEGELADWRAENVGFIFQFYNLMPVLTAFGNVELPLLLTRRYGEGDSAVHALRGVSLDVPAGQFTAVMGPSGSGKSTLLHCIAGLDTLTSGQAFIGETDLSTLDDKKLTILRRDSVGFVFQSYNLVPTLTALENIRLPLDLAGRDPDRDWLDTVIDTIGLRDRLSHRPSELSGGQQQRVACARAMIARPEVIFADEPTGNLDSQSSGEVLGFLRRSVDETGQTIVMVTHDPRAASYADRALFLADGRIVSDLYSPAEDEILETLKELA